MKDFILNKECIVIVTHKSPDGDAIGSSLALKHYLNKIGKEALIIFSDDFPESFNWMNGASEILISENDKLNADKFIDSADLIFCLDFNSLSRTGLLEERIKQSSAYLIMIDHHQNPDGFADHIISRVESCSTAQLIYEFIETNGDLDLMDTLIGEGIYTGIIADTGSFKFSSVEPKTHLIASNLISIGLDHTQIHENIYDRNELESLHLLGFALNKIELISDLPVAFIALTSDDIDRFTVLKGSTQGLVNYCLSVKGVSVAALIREDKECVKMSFRSKGNIKVNEFADQYFNGGGHQNAAGGYSSLDFNQVIQQFKTCVKEFLS